MKRATKSFLQEQVDDLTARNGVQTAMIQSYREEKQADLEAMRQALDALRAAQSLIPEIEREKADLERANAQLRDQLSAAQEQGSSFYAQLQHTMDLAAQRGTEIRILIEKINQLEAG